MPKVDSIIWKYFKKINKNGRKHGSCIFCKMQYQTHAARMRRHLVRCIRCPEKIKNIFRDKSATPIRPIPHPQNDVENNDHGTASASTLTISSQIFGEKSTPPSKSKNQELCSFFDNISDAENQKLDIALARAIYATFSQLSLVENKHFIRFLKLIRPSYSPPSRFTVSNRLLNLEYETIQDIMKLKIASADNISIATDSWTDINGLPLINIILLTPEPIVYKAIDSKDYSHTSDYLSSILCESIEEIGFQKVHALVSDNAANMKGAWTLIKNKYPNISIYGCAGHGFNLLCKDITTKISVFQTILGDAKCVIQYFNNKHIPKAVLKSIQLEKNGKEIALLVPIETRWSSFCKSLESLIKNKDYLHY